MAGEKKIRSATINRDTNETKIQLTLNLDGGALADIEGGDSKSKADHASQSSKSQEISVDTGIGFLDHMLHALAKHGGWSLKLKTKGDLHIDDHHTAEDSCIALGQVSRVSSELCWYETDRDYRRSNKPFRQLLAWQGSAMHTVL